MSWGRDDPGFPPSPDLAAAAEEYFYQQSLVDGPDEPPHEEGCCHDCGAELVFVGYGGSPEDTYEVTACPKCDFPQPPYTATPSPIVTVRDDDDEVPF